MNKLHSFTKIILTAMGIYFAINLIPQIITFLTLFPVLTQQKGYTHLVRILLLFLVLAICLFVIFYLLMYKRQRLASMIVDKDEFPEPDIQIQWLPVAFRLICIFAGMFCLYHLFSSVAVSFIRYFNLKSVRGNVDLGYYFNTSQIIYWCVILIIGIYLVCGAPHFVRWQVKKTLELCKDQKGIKTYSSS